MYDIQLLWAIFQPSYLSVSNFPLNSKPFLILSNRQYHETTSLPQNQIPYLDGGPKFPEDDRNSNFMT